MLIDEHLVALKSAKNEADDLIERGLLLLIEGVPKNIVQGEKSSFSKLLTEEDVVEGSLIYLFLVDDQVEQLYKQLLLIFFVEADQSSQPLHHLS